MLERDPDMINGDLSRRSFICTMAGLGLVSWLVAGCRSNRCSGPVQESQCPTCRGVGRICNSKVDGRLVPADKDWCAPGTESTCPYCQGLGYVCR